MTTLMVSQIDRVVQARGELKRTNATMPLEMRESLTRAQWLQLQTQQSQWLNRAGNFVVSLGLRQAVPGSPDGARGGPRGSGQRQQ